MTADRRRHPRFSTRLEVDWRSENTFLFAYITDISALGIFVQTDRPAARGSRITLRFRTPDETFELEGEVAWSTTGDDDDDELRHGMGVQLVGLDDAHRDRIMALVQAVAYLDDPRGD